MPKKFYIVLAISLAIVLSILSIIIFIVDRRLKRKRKEQLFISPKSVKAKNIMISMYKAFSKFPLTKGLMKRISLRYEILYPGEQRQVYIKSMGFALTLWAVSLGLIYGLFIRNPALYNAAITMVSIWVAASELSKSSTRKIISTILKQLESFISDVRHFYYIKGSVDDAIQEAMEFAGKEMRLHANIIYDILTSDNMEEEVLKYNESSHNNYLKMFLAQCVSVHDYGDKKIDGESLFLINLKNLKNDINIKLRKIKQIQFIFMGVNFMILVPLLFLNTIREWAVSNIPELVNFYYGKKGLIMMTCIFIGAIILYSMVTYLKEDQKIVPKNYQYLDKISAFKPFKLAMANYQYKNYGRIEKLKNDLKRMGEKITPTQLFVKKWLFAICGAIFGTIFFLALHEINKDNIVNRISNVEQIFPTSNKQEKETITEVIQTTTYSLRDKKNLTVEVVIDEILNLEKVRKQKIVEVVAEEVLRRVDLYQTEYLKWYEVLIIVLITYISYCFPGWMIAYRSSILKMNMNDEVIEFQSIILMLIYIDRMTIPKILEFMETFAVIFKDSIRTCINDYDSGDIEALLELKERERFKPFQRIVDNFLISDKIGLELAFDEIAVDRANSTEQRKQEQEMSITNRGTLAKYIGYCFFILIILFYLAIPFMVECLSQFQLYNNEIGSFL